MSEKCKRGMMGSVESDNSNIPPPPPKKKKKVIQRDWGLELRGNCVSNSIYVAIHHFHHGHDAPYLTPKILQTHCFQFHLGI